MTARHVLSPARLGPSRAYGTLLGFVLLLAALFGVAYAAGAAAGPAFPGIHRTGDGTGSGGGPGDMGGMDGMDGMNKRGGMSGMHGMGAPAAVEVTR
ncbi:hypothetical protein AF335_30590 [Streptomyces eurocidicus]|uniref:Uncharacterized protein n=1 Tax=Streptomyces eurocidicus TaxID=66423 RepID=A0A2N8NNF6_STREU|nr:hypothetical protein [Streptomyces eurocidicus]MBB5118237.1 hypothetical protein [Streptomyces eurocidicus]MBF6054614.1 hypothetical protein [Streptomyces eurocidicus]PNE30287.1 hypothetical protein AF335_30590 [Streptomyces eurocidicus]